MINKQTVAVGLALTAAAISGLSNFVNKLAVDVVAQPVLYTFLKNGLVAIILLSALIISKQWREVKDLKKSDWFKLVAIGVVGGSIPFVLFFTGLTMTTAVSASLIHKTLFVWVTLLAIPFLHERLGIIQWAALGLLLFGNFFLGAWQQLSLGTGELMILAATIFWAIENIIAKKALKNLSSQLVAAARMSFGSVFLLVVVALQGNFSIISNLSTAQWGWTILTSVLLFGYVTSWYSALKLAPALVVASLLVPASLVTSALSLIFLNKSFSVTELISSACVVVAVGVLVWSHHRLSPTAGYVSPLVNK